jgi:hypothetical protein
MLPNRHDFVRSRRYVLELEHAFDVGKRLDAQAQNPHFRTMDGIARRVEGDGSGHGARRHDCGAFACPRERDA